jgi:hypothetical protein
MAGKTVTPRRRLTARLPLACVIGAIALGAAPGGAFARDADVVPASGTVAGVGYGGYLALSWQRFFAGDGADRPCQSLRAGGRRVAYLAAPKLGLASASHTCAVAAGQPVYMAGISDECSTLHGDHGTSGTAPAQLLQCASAQMQGAQETTTLDGHPIAAAAQAAGTSVYPIHLRSANPFGDPPGRGRAAAYGYGLLLRGLSRGTHTLRSTAVVANLTIELDWTVHAR